MTEPKIEIRVDENKIYIVTTSMKEEQLTQLFNDYSRGMARGRDMAFFENRVTELFAQEYLKRNFDEIAKMIDLETVKLLATRKLADVVSKNMGDK